ncbi:hypothetical protein [Neobacillus vireti]
MPLEYISLSWDLPIGEFELEIGFGNEYCDSLEDFIDECLGEEGV